MIHLVPAQNLMHASAVLPAAPAAVAFDDIFTNITAPSPLPCPPCSPALPVQKQPEPVLDVLAAIGPQKPTLHQVKPQPKLDLQPRPQEQPQPDLEKAETGPIHREIPQSPPVSKPLQFQPHSLDDSEVDIGSDAKPVELERQVQLGPQPDAEVLAQVSPPPEQAGAAGPLSKIIVDLQLKPTMPSAPSTQAPTDLPIAAKPKLTLALVSEPAQASADDTAPVTDNRLFQLPAVPHAAPTLAQAATPVIEVPVTVPTLELMQDALWLENLARDITASAATDGKLQFRLMPELLGKLDIALTHNDDRLDIAMQTSTETAARIITADQPRLVEELRQSGVKVGTFDMFSGQQNGAQKQQNQQPTPLPPSAAIESKPQRQRNRDARFA